MIAAGFDGGSPSYKPAEARKAQPVPAAVSAPPAAPAPSVPQPVAPRKVLFDDVDVPDFLKNGS